MKPFKPTLATTIIYLLVGMLASFSIQAQGNNMTKELLVLGDSLSAAYGIGIEEGWVSLLEKRLEEEGKDWSVRNVSISGSTTDNGLHMLRNALKRKAPDMILIELGANDGLRGFPVKQVEKNLRALVAMSKEVEATTLLTVIEIPRNYGKKYVDSFRQIYLDIAQEEEIALLPFLLETVYDKPELMQEDGLHPTAEAQPSILDHLWPGIQQAIDEHDTP